MLWGAIRIETSDGRYRFVEYLWGALVSSYEGSGLALRASVFLPNIILPDKYFFIWCFFVIDFFLADFFQIAFFRSEFSQPAFFHEAFFD